MKKGGRATGTRGPDGKNIIKVEGRFINTAVPRFNGSGCWQQHLQIVQAIVKSNGWTDGTAALQLFAHLDGEALNVALLMKEEKWAKWEGFSQGLSEYYNSPGGGGHFVRISYCTPPPLRGFPEATIKLYTWIIFRISNCTPLEHFSKGHYKSIYLDFLGFRIAPPPLPFFLKPL